MMPLLITLLTNRKPANLRYGTKKQQEIRRANKDGTVVVNIQRKDSNK